MTSESIPQSDLKLVTDATRHEVVKTFCGHCGREADMVEGSPSRVCPKCGLGLLLGAPADVAPRPGDPFLIVDGSLAICALSRQAEKLLGAQETDAVNRHVADFLVPGHAEAPTSENLAALITWAARGDAPSRSVIVRPANTFGVRYWARIGPCGPPTAALVVLADAR
jgi:hypothetical protein